MDPELDKKEKRALESPGRGGNGCALSRRRSRAGRAAGSLDAQPGASRVLGHDPKLLWSIFLKNIFLS